MKTLIFDTETTGLVNFKKAKDWKAQPFLVQIGAVLADENEIFSKLSLIVNPGAPIPREVAKIHGITTTKAQFAGVAPLVAVAMFNNLLKLADRIAGHNIDFDLIVMQAAYLREGKEPFLLNIDNRNRPRLPRVCTMKSSTPVINLPPTAKMKAAGFNKPKPPKLEEAVDFFFNEKLEGAHDALVDVMATRRILRELEARGATLIGGDQ